MCPTQMQCMQHWRNVLNPSVVKGKGSWTVEEDEKLGMLVETHGQNKWSFLGKFLPGRIGKQCRERCVAFKRWRLPHAPISMPLKRV